jgi:CheY-like chemotaxis protein
MEERRVILVVEDDETLLTALQAVLSGPGYQVQTATLGTAALAAIQTDPPDLIVTDVQMPGMNGLALLETVRNTPRWAKIPFIVISAVSTPDQEKQIATMDNVIFLRKPFEIKILLDAVAAALDTSPEK